MQSSQLQTHVTWHKGETLFNGIPGVLRLEGDEISFSSSDGIPMLKIKVNDVKEFSVFHPRGVARNIWGFKGTQWIIIPRQELNEKLSFTDATEVQGDNGYKDWQAVLAPYGITTYSDSKDARLIMLLCFIPVVILVVLYYYSHS